MTDLALVFCRVGFLFEVDFYNISISSHSDHI